MGMTVNCIWWWDSSLGVKEMWSTPSLLLLSGPLWPEEIVSVRILSMGWLVSAEEYDFPNERPRYDTKQSEDKVTVMLGLWEMRITPPLLSLPGPLSSGVVAPERVLSMGQIELNCVIILDWIVWN